MLQRVPVAGCGFLLAVLWFDLMFDSLVFGQPAGALSEDSLRAIAGYYARVTTGANPMGRLVGVVMVLTVGALAWQLYSERAPRLWGALSFAFVLVPVSLALFRIVPNAIRLGTRADSLAVQSELARSIAYEHVACLASIVVALALLLWIGREARSAGGTGAMSVGGWYRGST